MVKVKIEQKRNECIGCGVCVAVCPVSIWKMEDDNKASPTGDWNTCTYCLACQNQCPVDIIKIVKLKEE